MKKRLLLSLIFAVNIHASKATVPYYMENPNSSRIDAIKNDDARCGCSGDCNGSNIENPLTQKDEYNALGSEAINATQANCGCSGDCNGGDIINPFSK